MLAITGIGIHNAEDTVKSVLDAFNTDFLLSIGFAGALSEGVRIGDLVAATSVSLVSGNSIKESVRIPDERGLLNELGGDLGARAGSFFTLENLMKRKRSGSLCRPTLPILCVKWKRFRWQRLPARDRYHF